jgi:uncharacterized membrane protein/glutaredoxin
MKVQKRDRYHLVILIFSFTGLLLSLYLTYLYYSKAQAAFCSAGSGCDIVRESPYSQIAGIPVPLLGVFGYFLIGVLSIVSISSRGKWLLLYVISLAGFVFSAYLTYIELFVIHALCFYCVVSAILISAVFIILVVKKPALAPQESLLKVLLLSIVIAVSVLMGSLFLHSRERVSLNTDSSSRIGLAKHLSSIGAVMYGSYKCPHCLAQKYLFGEEAFKYIKYVECHPEGKNANPTLCLEKGITAYPTWEIKGKFYVGAKSLKELAKISGYSLESPRP